MDQRVSSHTARLIVKSLVTRTGNSPPDVLRALALAPDALASREATFSKLQMDALWDRALTLSGDEGFGLSLASLLEPGVLGPVEYLFRNMNTLGAAYDQAVRFQNLLQQNTSRWRQHADERGVVFAYELLPPVALADRHIVEFAIASFVALGRAVATKPWTPVSVRLAHARGAAVASYAEALGVVPNFEADANEVFLSAETCAIEVDGADERLADIVLAHARREHERIESTTAAAQVSRAIHETMHLGDVSLPSVAKRLGLGDRTLRRRLAEEGATFQQLVDAARFSVARTYLDQGKLSTAEIALLLGFHDVGAMYKAFKRWAGCSLSEYRAAHSER